MALILEVLHGGRGAEVRERHRLDGGPLEIGRALANQVVLDDPADPTPYWLVSSARPEVLAEALRSARASGDRPQVGA